jgi:hypothetical protein
LFLQMVRSTLHVMFSKVFYRVLMCGYTISVPVYLAHVS